MQKKQWNNPEVLQLGIEETQGGVTYDPAPDGAPWYDAPHKTWQTPSGKS